MLLLLNSAPKMGGCVCAKSVPSKKYALFLQFYSGRVFTMAIVFLASRELRSTIFIVVLARRHGGPGVGVFPIGHEGIETIEMH